MSDDEFRCLDCSTLLRPSEYSAGACDYCETEREKMKAKMIRRVAVDERQKTHMAALAGLSDEERALYCVVLEDNARLHERTSAADWAESVGQKSMSDAMRRRAWAI